MTVNTGNNDGSMVDDSTAPQLIGLWKPTDDKTQLIVVSARIWAVLNHQVVSREIILDLADHEGLTLTDEQIDQMVDAANGRAA